MNFVVISYSQPAVRTPADFPVMPDYVRTVGFISMLNDRVKVQIFANRFIPALSSLFSHSSI